jgi:hypothetical protein
MPIGTIYPGSYVDVTADSSPSALTTLQAPTATTPVSAAHLQALTLAVVNGHAALNTDNANRIHDIAYMHQLLTIRQNNMSTPVTIDAAQTAYAPVGGHVEVQLATNDYFTIVASVYASARSSGSGSVTLGWSTNAGASWTIPNAATIANYVPADADIAAKPPRPTMLQAPVNIVGPPGVWWFSLLAKAGGGPSGIIVYDGSCLNVECWRPGAGRSF